MSVSPQEVLGLENSQVAQHPILEGLSPYLSEVSDFLFSDNRQLTEAETQLRSLGERRRILRKIPSQLESATSEAISVTIGLLLTQPDDSDLEERAERLTKPYFKNLQLEGDMFVLDSVRVTRNYHKLSGLAEKTTRAIHEVVGDDIAQQYELMKLLTRTPQTIEADEDPQAVSALQAVATFEHMQKERSDSLYEVIEDRLDQGEFDSFIASDLLSEAVGEQGMDKQRFNANDLRQLVSLIRRCTDVSEERAILLLSQPESLLLWGNGYKSSFVSHKSKLASALRNNFVEFESGFTSEGYHISGASEKKHARAMENLILTAKQVYGRAVSPREVVALATRKRQRQQRVAETTGPAAAANTVELVTEPKKLVFLDSQGREVPETDGQFNECIETYVKSHQGESRLREDVHKILEYLRAVDLSAGIVRGIKKYKQPFKRGEKSFDLFALKPSDAVGLSTATKSSKKIRVLFTHSEGHIGLVGITDRDGVPRFEKSLGLNTSAGA